MDIQNIPAQDLPKQQPKDTLKSQLKGKPNLSQQDKDSLLLQIAKDLGYIE